MSYDDGSVDVPLTDPSYDPRLDNHDGDPVPADGNREPDSTHGYTEQDVAGLDGFGELEYGGGGDG